jgi:squalene-associated FAD-dependent desaturase
VLVLESRSRLGGRATAFEDRETGELVDNGQHVLLGCYVDTFAFLREIGAAGNVRLESQLAVSVIDRQGRRSRLTCPDLPSPLHLLGGIFDWSALGWRDRLAALGMRAPLKLARRELQPGAKTRAASPGETVEAWLIRNGQTPRLRELLWDPLALAALNQPPDRASAPPFARVLAEMFSNDRHAAAIALPAKPLHEMYAEPARRYLERRGSVVRTGVTASVRIAHDRVAAVETPLEQFVAPTTIAAVPWFALPDLFAPAPESLTPLLDAAKRTSASPIVTVNLWFDRPIIDEPFLGLPGRAMQWVFDKRQVFGGATSHLSLVSSGADAILRQTNEELIAAAHTEILEALPHTRTIALVRATVIREPRATFSLAPGQPKRPSTETPIQGLLLAGDWVDTGLPATIESAVRSGHRAAHLAIAS